MSRRRAATAALTACDSSKGSAERRAALCQ